VPSLATLTRCIVPLGGGPAMTSRVRAAVVAAPDESETAAVKLADPRVVGVPEMPARS